MSRVKYNLVGNTFTHLTNGNKGYSVHGKEAKNLEWTNDNPFASLLYTSPIPRDATLSRMPSSA